MRANAGRESACPARAADGGRSDGSRAQAAEAAADAGALRRQLRRWQRTFAVLDALALAGTAAVFAANFARLRPQVALILICGSAACWAVVLLGQRLAAQRSTAVLATWSRTRSVGALIELMAVPAKTIRAAAVRRLTALLPDLSAEEYAILSSSQVAVLCRMLREPDEALVLGILLALGRHGGPECLDEVRRVDAEHSRVLEMLFAQMPAPFLHDRLVQMRRLAEASHLALPHIEARARAQAQAASLLRPAEPSSEGSNMLLRPAASAGPSEADQLVRAVGVPDEPD